MRVKWNRHLDLGVRPRTCESEPPEITNDASNIEGDVSISANSVFGKKAEVQQDSNGFLSFFRTKKIHRDDLSQCSVTSSTSGGGHLVRRASLPVRLKRKFRNNNDCGRPDVFHSPETTGGHNNAGAGTFVNSPLTIPPGRDIGQHHSAVSEEIIWKRQDDGLNHEDDFGHHVSTAFSRDSPWRQTLPVPRNETESSRFSVYHVRKNPTLTKSASLSTCQPTDPPCRQTISNFSQSIKSLEPTATQTTRSGKVNLFGAAKSFFSGTKTGNKKTNSSKSLKLKRSVSVSDSRGKSEVPAPDAGPSGIFTHSRWNSVSCRVRSQSNVQEIITEKPPKTASKLSELFTNFRSSLKSLDSRSNREHYNDDDWSEHRFQTATENNSVSSLLIYDANRESNAQSHCSLEGLNEVVVGCLLLPEKNAPIPEDCNGQSYDDQHSNDLKISKTRNNKQLDQGMTKCQLTTFECSNNLIHSKEFQNVEVSTVSQMLCSNQSHVYDVKFNEEEKAYSTDKDRASNRQPTLVKKDSELVRAPDTTKIDSYCNPPGEKIPACQQVVVSSVGNEKSTQESNPHNSSLHVVNSDYLIDRKLVPLYESTNGIYDNDRSETTCKEAKQQVEPVIKNDENTFGNSKNISSYSNNIRDDLNTVIDKDLDKSNLNPQVANGACQTTFDREKMNSLCSSTINGVEQLPITNFSKVVKSIDVPIQGISTLDGTIVLADDRPIFCDSNLILHNDSNVLPCNAGKVGSHSFQEKAISINEIFVPSSNCSVFEKNQDPALIKHDREHYDPVASLNPPNDEIKTGHSNEPRSSNEPDSIKDNTDEDAIKGIEISFQMAAASNYASCDVIATERDAAENTVDAVESVEKQYTSDLYGKGIGLHDSVSHGRYGKEKSGKEEIAKTCGRHSPPIAFPFVDGTVSNPRGRVRWSDTLQSFTASTEEGRKLNERSSLSCGSSLSPVLIRLSSEEKSSTISTASTTTSCLTQIQTHVTVNDRCPTKEVMLSDSITTTKSAIKDISGAIAELQNAISSTFGLGCGFSDEDLLVQDDASENNLPTVQPSNWSNDVSKPPFCDKPEIPMEEYGYSQEPSYLQEEVPNCKSNLSNVITKTNCALEDDLSSHRQLLLKTRNLSDAKHNDVVMKETYVHQKFCDDAENYEKITIADNLPSAKSVEKDTWTTSSHMSLPNGELPHANTAEEQQFVPLDSQNVQRTTQANNKTTTETLVKAVGCVANLEGNPVLNMNGDAVIHLSQSINVPIDAVENLLDATNDSVLDVGDAKEVSNSRNTVIETTCQVADLTKSTQLLNFDSLENFHCLQINSALISDIHGLHLIGSLDRIPKSNPTANDSLTTNLSTLWKCKSEEMLPVVSNRGCCTSDIHHGGSKTFCRLRRSKALAKVCIKSIKEDAIFPRRNIPKTIKPYSLVKVKPAMITPLLREEIISPNAPNHPCPSAITARTSSDPKDGNNGISPCVMTPTIQIDTKETNYVASIHPPCPNGIDADPDIISSDSLKDTKMSAKKKNIANGIGPKLVNSMSSKQTSLEAVCQVPRPLRGNNTPVSKSTNAREMTEKTGLHKGHARSRSSRIPRKQHEGGRPIVPPKPVRPPMWLSKAELTQEIQHLSSLCESRTKELNRLKMQTKHVTRGFDALAVAIQYMADDLHVFENPSLLLNLKQTQEKVNKEKKDLECYEKKIAALNTLHAKEMNELLETLTTRHESELQELLLKHTTEINFLREQHKNELVSFTEALQASCEEERLQQEKLVADLRKELKQQREEVEMFHQQELDDLEERYHERQNTLKEEIRKLQKQLSDAKQTSCTMEETMQKDTDSKLHWLSEKRNDLQKEVESLKAVLEIKNNELHSLRKENLEMQKEVEELPLAKERIKMLHARAEDLQALMSEKVQIERQLSTEHKILTENYEKEAKVNKRLSMENEELQWRLKQVAEQSLLSHTAGDISETNAPDDAPFPEESCSFDEELPSPIKCSSPISSSKPIFFTYMNDEELALSSHSPRMHYKQIKPCSSTHRPSSAKSIKSASSPSPRKSRGSADSSPHFGGGTPRKMAKHLDRAAQRSSAKQKLSSSSEAKTQEGYVHESLEINVIGLTDSLVSSASSDNSVFEPCLLEEHGDEIRETLKRLQEQNNTEFIYDVSSPTFDSNGKWHMPMVRSEGAATDQNISLESIDPKTFYHVAFPVMRDSEPAAEETEKVAKELSE